jgi:hypothetical protein
LLRLSPILRGLGRALASYLSQPNPRFHPITTIAPEALAAAIRPGDVLLVEGDTRISSAIKYLTQSTWSHAALYVGDRMGRSTDTGEPLDLIEADIKAGVRAVPLSRYQNFHTRICRAVGLTPEDMQSVIGYAISRIGQQYDLRNVMDLARYLISTPPVPVRWRRRMLALGSGEPTRAICSTLIAQAFQSVRYPILPTIQRLPSDDPDCNDCYDEILHIRHHSLFAPRDFDISPYFKVIKPSLVREFDYRALRWADYGEFPADATGPEPDAH